MALIQCNVIKIDNSTIKLFLLNWDRIPQQEISSVSYESTEYTILSYGYSFNSDWLIISGSASDFQECKIFIDVDVEPPQTDSIIQFSGENVEAFNAEDIIQF